MRCETTVTVRGAGMRHHQAVIEAFQKAVYPEEYNPAAADKGRLPREGHSIATAVWQEVIWS